MNAPTPSACPVMRMFPIGTAGYQARLLATLLASTSLFSGMARATLWDGSTSTDWNDPTNWVGDAGTGGSNAEINTDSPRAVISANLLANPVDILVGNGTGALGRLDHTAGTAATGGGNWMLVGRQGGGTGVYNLANTSAAGGTLTGFGVGTGSMNVQGRLYVGGANYVGSIGTGTVNVNTSGTLAIGNDLAVGSAGGTGVMNVDGGTITTGGWNFVGKNEALNGATGTLNMSGGLLTNTGRTYVGQAGSTGTINLTGGTYRNVNNEQFIFGEGTGAVGTLSISSPTSTLQSGGELWFGQAGGTGNLNLSAGTITVNNWVAVGRDGGTGNVVMSGGTITKTGGGNFIVGASGPGNFTQTGGLVDVQGGITWMGENSSATVALSGTAEYRTSVFTVAAGGAGNGIVGLDGGILRTGQIIGGGGTAEVDFNGTRIIATANETNFITNLDTALLEAGGLVMDTNGFNLTAPQVLTGAGGVTKSGLGTLILNGTNTYAGTEAVTAGTLMVTTGAANAPSVTVADGTTYGITQTSVDAVLTRNNVTFGTAGASRLDINLGNFASNTANPPLRVTGTLRLNGPTTINIADQLPEVGVIPLIAYTGPKAGTGAFVLGTLPNGVVATLTDNGSQVFLTVTSVALPYWDATVSNQWDTTTINWINLVGGAPTAFANGNPALFNDLADGPGAGSDVVLNTTVTPSNTTFNNANLLYSLSGTGKITGPGGLVKQGAATLTISNSNDYTGVTSFDGGTTLVNTFSNGSTASPLGAASAAPSNLVFNGGALEYTGPATTTDRGFTIAAANSTFSVTNALTVRGPVLSSGGNLIKSGAGSLTLTNPNLTFGTANPGLRVAGGGLVLDGSASPQTVSVSTDLWVGNVPDVPASLDLKNTNLTIGGFLALGRGNGASGTLSTITATNSTLTTGNFSTGFNGDLPSNDSDQSITLTNTKWTNNGQVLLGESQNATTDLRLNGTSSLQVNDRLLMGIGVGSVVNVTIENSASMTKTGGWLAIGNSNNATATVTVKDSGVLTANNDFNIADVGASTGVLNIQDNATVNSANVTFIGKSDGNGTGSANGTLNQSGGTFNGDGTVVIARYANSTGTLNISGGVFNENGAGNAIVLGEEGNGTLTISGTGVLNANGVSIFISNSATGTGTLNLNTGGTLVARRLLEGAGGAGTGSINFNGGLLKVGANPDADFLNNLSAANIFAGGANIDTNGSNVAIAQPLLDAATTGGLTKSGLGFLQLNGGNTFTGLTTVSAGSLGGIGSLAGALTVSSGGTIAPGAATTGTFTVGGPTTLTGTYQCEIDGGANDTLAVSNTLNVSAATLALTPLAGGVTSTAYVLATYTGATPAPFAAVTGLPSGYVIDYAYNDGVSSQNIALVASSAPTPYTTWISGFYPGNTDPATVGPNADPDKDGEANALEFVFGGRPNSGTANAKIYHLIADANGDADTTPELLMTLAVRTGTPAFTGVPMPAATFQGFTASVEGTTTLSSFPITVTPVGLVATGLPAAPSGYEYRTFSLSGSNGLPGRGFIRARVSF